MDTMDEKMLQIRARYVELVNQAAKSGIDLLNVLDPAGVSCNSGTGCCAGDGKALDAREMVERPDIVSLRQFGKGGAR